MDFINRLLEALKDREVRECIKEIVNEEGIMAYDSSKEENDRLKGEVARLNDLLEKEREDSKRLRQRVKELETEQEEQQKKLKDANQHKDNLEEKVRDYENAKRCWEKKEKRMQEAVDSSRRETKEKAEKLEYYRDSFGELESYYHMYIQMDYRIHEDLARVLTTKNPELFLCWGSQWINIEQLWEYLSYNIEKESYPKEQIQSLVKIFDYFFQKYQQINRNYERLHAEIGDEFDEDIHARAKNSRVAGNISQVLLLGYRKISDGKMKKSIVRV